ncbi:MAG: hypothetical protein U1E13_05390 [Methylophilaceae bacterium]|nr:hypothetical protein [Methylophilaceae bacterium]
MAIPLNRDTFIWGIATLCNLHRIPFDAELLIRRFPPTYDLSVLQSAVKSFGFKVSLQASQLQALHSAVFPVLVLLNPIAENETSEVQPYISEPIDLPPDITSADQALNTANPEPAAPDYGLALVIKTDGERVLLITQDSVTPKTIPLSEFNTQFAGQIILATPQQKAVEEDIKAPAKFGFRWFIPELLKHKKIWREILLASFAIQLVALATPLGTQVIIDKVVVHHTVSTLIVIAVALGIFLIFNAAMGWYGSI